MPTCSVTQRNDAVGWGRTDERRVVENRSSTHPQLARAAAILLFASYQNTFPPVMMSLPPLCFVLGLSVSCVICMSQYCYVIQ